MKPAAFEYVRARTIDEALSLLSDQAVEDSKIYAGGQSLGPMLNLRLARPGRLVDIRHVPELRTFEADTKRAVIGALWTHAEIEDGILNDPTMGFMRFVASGIAYRAVRNRGTMGGSLAHADPAADWVTATTVLNADMIVQSANGKKSVVPASEFIEGAFMPRLARHDILIAIRVPRLHEKTKWAYEKVCRKTGGFAKAIGAAIIDPKSGLCRVVAGAVQGRPILLERCSAALRDSGAESAIRCADDEVMSVLPYLSKPDCQVLCAAVRRSLANLAKQDM